MAPLGCPSRKRTSEILMAQNELAKSLSEATLIVGRFISGKTSAKVFIESYSNFYYYEALDGHEPTSAQDADERTKYWLAIELHRRIQQEVVNQLALDAAYSREDLKAAGRIDEVEARERALEICAAVGLNSIIEGLEG